MEQWVEKHINLTSRDVLGYDISHLREIQEAAEQLSTCLEEEILQRQKHGDI